MDKRLRDIILHGPHVDLRIPPREPIPEPEPEPVEPRIETGERTQHTLLLADSGAGKTNVMCWGLNNLFDLIARGEHTAILTDPWQKGVLTADILRLQKVWNMRDRVVWIEPYDSPASINIFKLDDDSAYALEQAKEKIGRTLGTVAISITDNQAIPFSNALEALFALPEAERDIFKLQQILSEGIAKLTTIRQDRLPESVRRYFDRYQTELLNKNKRNARADEMVEKLNAFLDKRVFASLFSTKQKPFDIFEECQKGRLIIIDCSRAPKEYGQFWIEEIAATIGRRLALLKQRKHVTPVTFFIDEAQEYIGNNEAFANILVKARQSQLATFVALHNLAQDIEPKVMHALVQNSHVKFIARTTDHVPLLCKTMGKTDPELIYDIPEYHFAYFNRRQHMAAAEIVNLGVVDFADEKQFPQITEEQEAKLREMAHPKQSEKEKSLPPAPQRETRRPTGVTETAKPVPTTSDPITTETPKTDAPKSRRDRELGWERRK